MIERWRPPSAATGLASHGWTDEQTVAFAAACASAGLADVRHERRGALVSVVAR